MYASAISVTLNFEPVTSMSSVSRGLARDQQNTSIHSEDIKLRNGLTDTQTLTRLLYASGAYLAGGRIKHYIKCPTVALTHALSVTSRMVYVRHAVTAIVTRLHRLSGRVLTGRGGGKNVLQPLTSMAVAEN